ncbi:MAG: hypothetical protein J6Y91_00740 [Alphaproteobacteria bacterium]|nr:hypothetical protein [Alphaproteobacteria bacterium]
MKKTAILSALIMVTGCAAAPVETQSETPENAVVQTQMTPAAMPCSYSCNSQGGCYSAPQPVVLKPRVTEVLRPNRKRRCCPDEPVLPGQEGIVYVPDAPEIYVISANRTVNSMQKEAAAFLEQIGTMKVYVADAKPKADDLPGGIEKGIDTLRNRFANLNNVILVDRPSQADFIINSVIDWYDTPTKTVPAIKYDMFLNAKDGHVIGEWSEIIHQTEGDRSWW